MTINIKPLDGSEVIPILVIPQWRKGRRDLYFAGLAVSFINHKGREELHQEHRVVF